MDRLLIQEWRPILFEREAPVFLSVLGTVETGTGTLSFEGSSAQMEKDPSEIDLKTAEDPYRWTDNVLFLL